MARIPNWVKVLMLKGEKGDNGFSPTLSETEIDNGYRVTITDADGTSSFDLHNATSGDYSGLTNKPSINDVVLSGNKTSSALKMYSKDKLKVMSIYLEQTQTIPANSFGTLNFIFPDGLDYATYWKFSLYSFVLANAQNVDYHNYLMGAGEVRADQANNKTYYDLMVYNPTSSPMECNEDNSEIALLCIDAVR